MKDLRYPIGRFSPPGEPLTPQLRSQMIDEIEQAPAAVRAAVQAVGVQNLDTPYRPGGWTVAQVVHHLPDSHLNAYIRFKLALTEDEPEIKTYDQEAWAQLADGASPPIEMSLLLLESLHERWVRLLRSLQPEAFRRSLKHPEWGTIDLDTLLSIYAWHGKHHTAHIYQAGEGKS